MADTTGILKNSSNIFDATQYKTSSATVIYDDKYQDGNAITCSDPSTIIFDTGILPAGTFVGTYAIGFFYDSTTATAQGTPLMRFELYENGILMSETVTNYWNGSSIETIYEYDLNYVEYINLYGLFDTKILKASSTYQLLVKTADTLNNNAILDYITFSRIGENTIADGFPIIPRVGCRNNNDTRDISAQGTQLTIEIVHGIIWGTWNANDNYAIGFTYNTPFKNIDIVLGTMYSEGNGQLNVDMESIDYANSQVIMNIRNNSSTSCSPTGAAINIKMMVMGYI